MEVAEVQDAEMRQSCILLISNFLTRRTTKLGSHWHLWFYPEGVASVSPGLRRGTRSYPGGLPVSSNPNGVSARWYSPAARNETKPPWGLESKSSPPQGRRGANPGLEAATPLGLSIEQVPSASQKSPAAGQKVLDSSLVAVVHSLAFQPFNLSTRFHSSAAVFRFSLRR